MTVLQLIAQYEERINIAHTTDNNDMEALALGTFIEQFLEDLRNCTDRLDFCGSELADFIDNSPLIRWYILLQTMRSV